MLPSKAGWFMSETAERIQTAARSKLNIIDYVPHIVLTRHWNGTLYCTKSGDLSTMNRDGLNKTQIYNFAQNGYSGYNIDRAIVLPSGTMLVALTNYTHQMIIMRSSNLSYTVWEEVNNQWLGGMLYQSWAFSPDGTVVAGEYNTSGNTQEVRLWKAVNDGRDWSIIYTFDGRQGIGAHEHQIFHIHNVGYDPYTGIFWFGTGDLDPEEPLIGKYDGVNVTIVGKGTQHWRPVSFAFTEEYIYWGMDGGIWVDGGYQPYMVRLDKATEELEILSPVNTIFVTHKIEGDFNAKFISNGDPNSEVFLSNDGVEWYKVYEWEHDTNVPYPPWRVFFNFVDGQDGRFYAYFHGLINPDTGLPINHSTVVFEIEDEVV